MLRLGKLKVERVIIWVGRPRAAFMEEIVIKRGHYEWLESEQKAKERIV